MARVARGRQITDRIGSHVCSCSIWGLYGMIKGDNNILVVNVVGGLFGLYYTFVYYQFTNDIVCGFGCTAARKHRTPRETH